MKKILSIFLSILMVLLILPAKDVNATPGTGIRYVSDLQIGDVIYSGEKIQQDETKSKQIGIVYDQENFDSTSYYDEFEVPDGKNYTVSGIWVETEQMRNVLVLAPVVKVNIYFNDSDNVVESHLISYIGDIVYENNRIITSFYGDEIRELGSFIVPTPATVVGNNVSVKWTTEKYSTPQDFPAYEETTNKIYVPTLFNALFDHNYDYVIKIRVKAYNPELSDFGVIGDSSISKNGTTSYIISLKDQNDNILNDTEKELTVQQVDATGADIAGVDPITVTYSNGYVFTVPESATAIPGNIFYKISCGSIEKTFAITIMDDADDDLANNGWPWASAFGDNTVTLNAGLKSTEGKENITYAWEVSTNGNVNENFNDTDPACTTSSYAITYTTANKDNWYRCRISYKENGGSDTITLYTKAVQLLKDTDVRLSAVGLDSTGMNTCYVSNGKGAYTLNKSTGKFNVLGLWNDWWVHTSYDCSWSIYMKETGTTGGDIVPLNPSTNIVNMYARFRDYNTSYVIFDVKLNESCDAAIYTDVCLADGGLFDYSDSAAVKANLNNDKSLSSIQMLAQKDFASSTKETCSFVIVPIMESVYNGSPLNNVSTFAIDCYDNTDWDNDFEWECMDDSTYDDPPWDEYDYDWVVEEMEIGLFNYSNTIRPDYEYSYPGENPFIRDDSLNAFVGIYDSDSVLAMSWADTDEISYMFGVGKAGSLSEYVNFIDIKEQESDNGGGHYYIEVPNTSASIR